MLNGKQKRYLRSLAVNENAIFQIGKDNITEPLVEAVDAALKKRELIKLSVLETSELSAKEAAEQLAEATGAEIIQCIGRKLVLYRKREEEE